MQQQKRALLVGLYYYLYYFFTFYVLSDVKTLETNFTLEKKLTKCGNIENYTHYTSPLFQHECTYISVKDDSTGLQYAALWLMAYCNLDY